MRTEQTYMQRENAAIGIGLPLDAAYVALFDGLTINKISGWM